MDVDPLGADANLAGVPERIPRGERGGGLNVASAFEIDDVIDPAETRHWLIQGLNSTPNPDPIRRGRAQFLNTW